MDPEGKTIDIILIRVASSTLVAIRRLQFPALFSRRTILSAIKDKESSAPAIHGERYLRRLLWYLLGGTRGGPSRVEILKALRERPLNANQLAGAVHLDYKTIEHHLRVLKENGLVTSTEKVSYGAALFLTPAMEDAWPLLEEIWDRIGRTKIKKTEREG